MRVTSAAAQLYEFLLADLEATESTAYAEALLAQAKAKITAGQGQLGFLNSSSLNGKNFGRMLVCTALDVATAARAALNYYDDASSPTGITFVDFSNS